MDYVILNNGCSFSADWSLHRYGYERQPLHPRRQADAPESLGVHPNVYYAPGEKKKLSDAPGSVIRSDQFGWTTYCKYLPGKIYNIAMGGTGIESDRLASFISDVETGLTDRRNLYTFQENFGPTVPSPKTGEPNSIPADLKVTHFIYQLPSLCRQVMHTTLNYEDFIKAPIGLREAWEEYRKSLSEPYDHAEEKRKWKDREDLWRNIAAESSNLDKYVTKALNSIHESVTMVRKKWPGIKIILLKYVHSHENNTVAYVFSKLFYKNDIRKYCDDNNVAYIYEKNFHTHWFAENGLANDRRHPNEAGARLIASKIKEYL